MMRKRILAAVLALMMCLGLAVPALAANEAAPSAPKIDIVLPEGGEPQLSTGDYQVRGGASPVALKDKTTDTILGYMIARSSEPESFSLSTYTLPVGTTINIKNLRNVEGGAGSQIDVMAIQACSDPDGDGVYDQWIYDFTKTPPVVPLEKETVGFPPSENNGRYSHVAFLMEDNKLKNNDMQDLPDAVTVTTDYLSEVFGPNTLIVLDMQIWTVVSADPQIVLQTGSHGSLIFLIDDEKAADSSSEAPAQPEKPAVPAAPAPATPTSAKVLVNGESKAFDAYEIGGSNFFKLRDLAYVLSGTEKQFEVGWDGAASAISLTSGQAYTPVGGEMAGKGAGAQTAKPSAAKIILDGKEISLTAYEIGGNNYFKLRDIGETFGFGIGWDGESQTITIDTSTGYTA